MAERREPGKIRQKAREIDSKSGLVDALRTARELLPGSEQAGDEVVVGKPGRPQALLARYVNEIDDRPSAARELGLGVMQLSRAFTETRGQANGKVKLAIVFTDLVAFSSWALEAGDGAALELLRAVGRQVEPAISSHSGKLIKRLGDGHMAVFKSSSDAVEASLLALDRLREVEVAGHRPEMRIGVHVGYPRRVKSDYLGVDVNVAARVAAAARGGEVLVSEPVREDLGDETFAFKARRGFRAKGAPSDLAVYAVTARGL
jgi:adenylate cyclase